MIAHSLGLGAHERPWCPPLEEFVLEPGTALSVESIFHSPGPMYHIEDFVIIGQDGHPVCVTDHLGSATPVRIE
jgi:Xaa-Pro aminopeptidase